MFSSPRAPRMNEYMPSNTRMKLPEIPGNIMAQMAITPEKKMKYQAVFASVGEITVMQ